MFKEVFLGYQPHQVSVCNQHFEDHLGPHHQGSDMSTESHSYFCMSFLAHWHPSDPWWWGQKWSLKHQFPTDVWHGW